MRSEFALLAPYNQQHSGETIVSAGERHYTSGERLRTGERMTGALYAAIPLAHPALPSSRLGDEGDRAKRAFPIAAGLGPEYDDDLTATDEMMLIRVSRNESSR